MTVTTHRRRTSGGAGVAVIGVAVIAPLTVLNDAIAAAGWLAIGAGVGRVFVAVITAFARTDNSVTATRLKAGAQASICVLLVAVITSLIARLALFEVESANAITAASDEAIG